LKAKNSLCAKKKGGRERVRKKGESGEEKTSARKKNANWKKRAPTLENGQLLKRFLAVGEETTQTYQRFRG